MNYAQAPVAALQVSQLWAVYKVVRVEAAPANDAEITCRSCGGPLLGREGGFVFKYFLVERPGEQKYRAGRIVTEAPASP